MLSANVIENIKEQAYAGFPTRLSNIPCAIYPGMMRDMLETGSRTYWQRLGTLLIDEATIEKSQKDERVQKMTPLEFLLLLSDSNNASHIEIERIFRTFIKEDFLLLPKYGVIVIGPPEKKQFISNNNFEDFQNVLRIQHRMGIPEGPPPNETPGQKKMRLLREKRDAVKRKQQQKESDGTSLLTQLSIAEVFGIDYLNKSIYAFYELLSRYQKKEKWDMDFRSICAGADSKKIKMKYWGE